MKTEMKMLPNGNYERIISPIQHKCVSEDYDWKCVEYASEIGRLRLQIEDGDPFEDGYCAEIDVQYCPFCGYQPERSKREELVSKNAREDFVKHDYLLEVPKAF